MEIVIEFSLPRETSTAPLTRQILDSSLRNLGVSADVRADLTIALSEACANAIRHADDSPEYEVRAYVEPSRCVIEVVDSGCGFQEPESALEDAAPAPLTAESGRGLHIIRTFTENLQIIRRLSGGSIVRFEKPLKWVPGAAVQHMI